MGLFSHFKEQAAKFLQECQPVVPRVLILCHNHHIVEETIHRCPQSGQFPQHRRVIARGQQGRGFLTLLRHFRRQGLFGFFLEQGPVDGRQAGVSRLAEYVADPLIGGREGFRRSSCGFKAIPRRRAS